MTFAVFFILSYFRLAVLPGVGKVYSQASYKKPITLDDAVYSFFSTLSSVLSDSSGVYSSFSYKFYYSYSSSFNFSSYWDLSLKILNYPVAFFKLSRLS